jgi:esterase/lipase superfamily enzyme
MPEIAPRRIPTTSRAARGVSRLGEIDPTQEPYKSELARENIEVFDLSKLNGNAHNRAFDDITTVVTMIKDRIGE